MKNLNLKPFIGGAFALFLVVVSSGCESCKPGMPGTPGQYTIEISRSDSLKDKNILVDLVPATPLSLPGWENYDMGKYWSPGDDKRRDAEKVELKFVAGQSSVLKFPITDARWKTWSAKKITDVLVLVDLTTTDTSRPGNQDPRRLILQLGKCIWPKKTAVLKVEVKGSGMEVLTPLR